MSTIKISIIIPVYNTAPYLRACLDSAVSQTLEEIEILAIDDGSTDESPAILKEYAAKHSRLQVITTANMGVGDARNLGAARARGEYLWFVDGDDWIEPDACRLLYDRAKKTGCDLLLFDRMDHSPESATGSRVCQPLGNLPDGLYPDPSDRGCFSFQRGPDYLARLKPFVWDKLIRREYWNATAFLFPSRIRFQDLPVSFLLCAAASRIAYLPEICYHYRLSTGFHKDSVPRSMDLLETLSILEKELKGRNLWKPYRQAFTFVVIRHICFRFQLILQDTAPGRYDLKEQVIRASFRYLNSLSLRWRKNPLLPGLLPSSLRRDWRLYSSRQRMLQILRHKEGLSPEEQETYLLEMRQKYPFQSF